MKLLLHTCCAPCANRPIETLRQGGIDVHAFWYNPNIHPYTEYQARKGTLEAYAKEVKLRLIIGGTYDLKPFIHATAGNIAARCAYCYRTRLEQTARYAHEHGYDSFCTTLLISPYQNHALLCATGEALAQEYGVSFFYEDFRPLFQAGQEYARVQGMYMQKYCGCIFSEEERYMAAKWKKKQQTLDP